MESGALRREEHQVNHTGEEQELQCLAPAVSPTLTPYRVREYSALLKPIPMEIVVLLAAKSNLPHTNLKHTVTLQH